MKSNPYKLNGKLFRYNFDTCVVEYIQKADQETMQEDAEWKRNHDGRSLYNVGDDGYIILETIGLSRENWKDKEARDGYLSGFLLVLGVGGLIADYVFPYIPFIQRFLDSLPDWEDEEE